MSLRIIVISLLCTGFLFAESDLTSVSKTLRDYYWRKAKVWEQRDIPNTDILAGPQSSIAVTPEQEVTCNYVEGQEEGYAPKFTCKLSGSGETVLVKYKSRETFAEIAASRLLWTLGFFADENYPVKLKCLDCPKDPSQPSQARMERVFEDAIIEKNFPGEIGEFPDQGWEWDELDETKMEATKEQIDALKLLAVFIQHTDSKREQQRLGCHSQDIDRKTNTCKKPVLMIQDLGATFGKGDARVTSNSQMTLQTWKSVNIWNEKNRGVCIGNLTSAEFAWREGFSDPEISEGGRKFLANLLNQLSDQQIHDLFRVARADKTGEQIEHQGAKRPVTIEDWVAVFKDKRKQINDRRCDDRRL